LIKIAQGFEKHVNEKKKAKTAEIAKVSEQQLDADMDDYFAGKKAAAEDRDPRN